MSRKIERPCLDVVDHVVQRADGGCRIDMGMIGHQRCDVLQAEGDVRLTVVPGQHAAGEAGKGRMREQVADGVV